MSRSFQNFKGSDYGALIIYKKCTYTRQFKNIECKA